MSRRESQKVPVVSLIRRYSTSETPGDAPVVANDPIKREDNKESDHISKESESEPGRDINRYAILY